ncbi:MAG: hypothetical protein AAF985_11055 [Bacteroidota bacterium]
MKYCNVLLAIFAGMSFLACQSSPKVNGNPAASGFDLKNSDAKAIQIADEVMLAM